MLTYSHTLKVETYNTAILSTFHKIPATNSMNCYWILFINVFLCIPVHQHSATYTVT